MLEVAEGHAQGILKINVGSFVFVMRVPAMALRPCRVL